MKRSQLQDLAVRAQQSADDVTDSPKHVPTHSAPTKALMANPYLADAEEQGIRQGIRSAQGKALEVALGRIVSVPARRRRLTPEQYDQLKESLVSGFLVNPIVVKSVDGDKFEIIAGENRFAVYKELGRQTIPAIVREIPDENKTLASFVSNLIQPALTDYEKYTGVQAELAKGGQTQEAVAKKIGMPRASLSFLLSAFRGFPVFVHSRLAATPEIIGAKAAHELLKRYEIAPNEAVLLSIVDDLAESKLTQLAAAKAYAIRVAPVDQKSKNEVPIRVRNKSGKVDCHVTVSARRVVVSTKSGVSMDVIQAAIVQALERVE